MAFQLPKSVRGFHDYFKMAVDVETLVGAFGYQHQRDQLTLPKTAAPPDWTAALQKRLWDTLHVVSLDSETARREFLIAPLLTEVSVRLQTQLRTEKAIDVSPLLHGSLDYYLKANQNLLVVEAKYADTLRGFKQLAAELIALDQAGDVEFPYLYGAVSIGDNWRFGRLDRQAKIIAEDLTLYTVPDGLGELLRVLIAILQEP
jgi:hypothetical protein